METTWYTAAALKLLLWGALAAANIDLPPAKYDHPYRGHVQFVYDFPIESDGDYYWGYTVPPRRPGGKCLIHLSPIGAVIENQVMTEEMLRVLIRHETAHCGGWRHREEAIGRNDPFIVGPENPPPWPSPPRTTDANADNIKFKYLLQCGNAKSVPPDSDPDPIVDRLRSPSSYRRYVLSREPRLPVRRRTS